MRGTFFGRGSFRAPLQSSARSADKGYRRAGADYEAQLEAPGRVYAGKSSAPHSSQLREPLQASGGVPSATHFLLVLLELFADTGCDLGGGSCSAASSRSDGERWAAALVRILQVTTSLLHTASTASQPLNQLQMEGVPTAWQCLALAPVWQFPARAERELDLRLYSAAGFSLHLLSSWLAHSHTAVERSGSDLARRVSSTKPGYLVVKSETYS